MVKKNVFERTGKAGKGIAYQLPNDEKSIIFSSSLPKIPTWRGWESIRACPALDARVRRKSIKREIKDPARLEWHEVKKVAHYYLAGNAMTEPMQVKEESAIYGDKT